MRTIYLGDGAYADSDGITITVYTMRGLTRHFVVLEGDAMDALIAFAKTMRIVA